MAVFNIFLASLAFLLSGVSIVLIYHAINDCQESEFVPLYYFIALSVGGVMVLSASRIASFIYGDALMVSSDIVQDLFISYIALFLFGSLWQSYEAEMCRISFLEENS